MRAQLRQYVPGIEQGLLGLKRLHHRGLAFPVSRPGDFKDAPVCLGIAFHQGDGLFGIHQPEPGAHHTVDKSQARTGQIFHAGAVFPGLGVIGVAQTPPEVQLITHGGLALPALPPGFSVLQMVARLEIAETEAEPPRKSPAAGPTL